MSDESILIDIQNDAYFRLLSEPTISTINVASLRRLLVDNVKQTAGVWLTPRAGKFGAGIIVGMPYLQQATSDYPGNDGIICLPVHVVESALVNSDPINGTLRTAEELALRVKEILSPLLIEGKFGLYCDGDCINPDDKIGGDSVICYTVTIKARLSQPIPARCALPSLTGTLASLTLTCSTSGASVYYTTDGSYPGPGNPAATLYTVSFSVASGTTVRYAAKKSALIGSDAGQSIVT